MVIFTKYTNSSWLTLFISHFTSQFSICIIVQLRINETQWVFISTFPLRIIVGWHDWRLSWVELFAFLHDMFGTKVFFFFLNESCAFSSRLLAKLFSHCTIIAVVCLKFWKRQREWKYFAWEMAIDTAFDFRQNSRKWQINSPFSAQIRSHRASDIFILLFSDVFAPEDYIYM